MSRAITDGLSNLLVGKGDIDDPERYTHAVEAGHITDETLRAFYRTIGMAKAIVDRPVDRSVRVGWDIVSDNKEFLEEQFKKIDFIKNLKKALKYERIYGGALIVLGINDGRTFLDPANVTDKVDVDFVRVYRREQVIKSNDLNRDPESERYGKPEYYEIIASGYSSYKVHYTRVVELDGIPVDEDTYIQNGYWGDSEIYTNKDAIVRYDDTIDNGKRIGNNFVNIALEIDGLFDAIRSGEEDDLKKRLRVFNSTLNNMNIAIHDKDEKIEKLSSVATGFVDILDRIADSSTLSSGIPARILFGKQTGGLNNSGEGETGDWVEYLEDFLNEKVIPVVEAVAKIFYKGEVVFMPHEVKPQTAEQKSKTYKAYADADKIYLEEGIIAPEEVRQSRFGKDGFGTSIEIDEAYNDVAFNAMNNGEGAK